MQNHFSSCLFWVQFSSFSSIPRAPTAFQEISSCLCQPGLVSEVHNERTLHIQEPLVDGEGKNEDLLVKPHQMLHFLWGKKASHRLAEESPVILACYYEHSHLIPLLLSMGRTCNLSGRQNNVPQRCPHPKPQNLWGCYLTWQKGLCRCD